MKFKRKYLTAAAVPIVLLFLIGHGQSAQAYYDYISAYQYVGPDKAVIPRVDGGYVKSNHFDLRALDSEDNYDTDSLRIVWLELFILYRFI